MAALAALMLFVALPASESAAQAAKGRSGAQVFLFRGFMNVFSLGMDELGGQLLRRGIPTGVYTHLSSSGAAEKAASDYQSGRSRTIIIMGHSLGAGAVVSMVEQLGARGIPVALAVTLDGSANVVQAGKVSRFVNLYIPGSSVGGGRISAGPRFSGSINNVDVSKLPDMGHLNIDKQAAVHRMLLGYVNQAIASGAPASPQAPTAGLHPAAAR